MELILKSHLHDSAGLVTVATFQIAYFLLFLSARVAAALTQCVLLHAVRKQLSVNMTIVGQNSRKSMLACILQNVTGCSRTSWYFWHIAFDILCAGTY